MVSNPRRSKSRFPGGRFAAAGAGEHLLASGGPDYGRFGTWLGLLGLYDLVFALVGYAVFDFLLED